ncbi:MSMEG_0570 family protein [Mesorhizobium plurifarium]|uniref:MSMEG_0570 family protein n=1 Tax=Mesorhizobium plurifarium TaxID=69974 RepID=A0A0K2VQ07_MESPL|nr:MSMEG_0570 family protein [Mesorhizobium plurifarium]
MRFVVVWPDGTKDECYSPSLVIKDFFAEGQAYAIEDFMERSRAALHIASERVRAKYGRSCALALGQLARLEQMAARFSGDQQARVRCETFIFDQRGSRRP